MGAELNPAQRLHSLGQSLWLDSINRVMLRTGTLARYVRELAVTGLTSNPTILGHAMAAGSVLGVPEMRPSFLDDISAARARQSQARSGGNRTCGLLVAVRNPYERLRFWCRPGVGPGLSGS